MTECLTMKKWATQLQNVFDVLIEQRNSCNLQWLRGQRAGRKMNEVSPAPVNRHIVKSHNSVTLSFPY